MQFCTISVLFFIIIRHTSLLLSSLSPQLQSALLLWLSIERSDFCVVELLFLFVPFSPWLPACRLAAPCVKGGCSRTDCGNSRLASLGPLLPIQRGSHQSSTPPAPAHRHTHTQKHKYTNAQPISYSHKNPTTLTPSPNNPRKQFHLDSGGGPLSPAPSIFPY